MFSTGREKLGIVGILQLEAVAWRSRRLDGPQPDETADAVLGMDNQRAGIEAGNLRYEITRLAPALVLADQAIAEDILLADDEQIAGLEPALQAQDRACGLASGQFCHIAKR